jgi:spore maturation protein CgeB
VVASGHSYSTIDCYAGLVAGFREAGYQTFTYDLHTRIDAAQDWLKFAREKYGKADDAPITEEDIIYQAGVRTIVKALEVNADAVVIVCGLLYHPMLLILLERMGMPVFTFGTESPYDDERFAVSAKLSTVASVNDAASVDIVAGMVRASGENTPIVHMPLGFNPSVHYPGFSDKVEQEYGEAPPAHDVVFVGNVYPSRERLLSAIDWTGIDLGLYGVFETVPDDSPLLAYKRGGIIRNVAATAIYQRSKLVLNLFRSEQFGPDWEVIGQKTGTAVNPRLIEAAAAGACIVSEWRPEVAGMFGDSIATFRTADECAAIIRRLLANPAERAERAAAAMACVAGHSYTDRARAIVGALEAEIARRCPAIG